MNIAIIGTGNVGGALASKWASAGHHIFLGVLDVNNFKGKELLENKNTSVHSVEKAGKLADAILIATPPQAALSIIEKLDDIKGKIIIDATNVIMESPKGYDTVFHAFEELTSAYVVKCFNTTGFENMKDTQYGNLTLDMYMAGDKSEAKEIAIQLSKDAGFENCYDFGKSDQVVLLEKFALSWINLAIFQGMGRDIAFKLVKR